MVFLLPAWANRPKEYKQGGMVHSKADGGRVNLAVGFPYGIYNSKMVDGGIIKSKWWMTGLNAMPNLPAPYNPGPGTPFYMSGNRNTISGAGGY